MRGSWGRERKLIFFFLLFAGKIGRLIGPLGPEIGEEGFDQILHEWFGRVIVWDRGG